MKIVTDQDISEMLAAGVSQAEVRRRTGVGFSRMARIKRGRPEVSPIGDTILDYTKLAREILRQQGKAPADEPAKSPRKAARASAPVAEVQGGEAILARLAKKPMTLAEVAEAGEVDERSAQAWIDSQQERGVNLSLFGANWSVEKKPQPGNFDAPMLEVISEPDGTYRLGAMGDTHLGSKYERLDVLNQLYDRYEAEGVRHVFHAGNWIEGEAPFNKHDVAIHGMDAQVRYLCREYPKRRGVETFAVAGDDHEGWYGQKFGIDIGKHAERMMREEKRSDWHHIGFMEAYVKLTHAKSGKSAILAVVHPGGGSSYALSYTVQKIVESYSGGSKPDVLFAGHYHKMELLNVRNVFCVQTGCTQDQTPFMRKKRLEAHVGGHVIRLRQDEKTGAIIEMNGMMRYFDVGYYNGRWSHAGPVTLPRRSLGGVA